MGKKNKQPKSFRTETEPPTSTKPRSGNVLKQFVRAHKVIAALLGLAVAALAVFGGLQTLK